MKERNPGVLVRDTLQLALMSLVTAVLVFQLGVSNASLMPALVVLAFMTPMVASAAVQLHRDVRRNDGQGGMSA